MPEDTTPAAPETEANDAPDTASDAANETARDTANDAASDATSAAANDTAHNDTANKAENDTVGDAAGDATHEAKNDAASDTANETTNNTAGDAAEPAVRSIAVPKRLVFRVPGTAYIALLFFVMCASSTALVSRWFTLIYLIPLGIAVWIMRTRTEVDADRIVVRRMLSRTTVPWSAIRSLRLSERGWVRAVRTDGGGEIALPTVRTRHLPALALISGGRISDPTVPPDQAPAQPDQTPA